MKEGKLGHGLHTGRSAKHGRRHGESTSGLHAVVVLGTLIPLVGVAGCSPRGLPGMVPLRGTVTHQGKPLTDGEVRYIPSQTGAGRMARGKIKEDGSFILTTATRHDGVMVGEYHIVVVAYGPAREPERDDQGFVTAVHPRPLLLPERYTSPESTPLGDTVDQNHDGFRKIEIVD